MWQLVLLMVTLVIQLPPSHAIPEEYLLHPKDLPSDLNFMPTLGNGHMGYTVYGDAIFMNGIYNGKGGRSCRARIPNWLNFTISFQSNLQDEDAFDAYGIPTDNMDKINKESNVHYINLLPQTNNYEMNLHDGYFNEKKIISLGSSIWEIEQRTYPHRYYNRALIYELLVRRIRGNAPLNIRLSQSPGNESDAFDFTNVNQTSSKTEGPASLKEEDGNKKSNETKHFKVLKGETRIVEQRLFQIHHKTIYIVFSDDFKLEQNSTADFLPTLLLNMTAIQTELYYRYVLTADESEAVARQEMENVLSVNNTELLASHTTEWHKFWETFNITIDNNLELSRIINAGIFYLASSLPSNITNLNKTAFYGLSPTGIGRGNLEDDYLGHNFWDTEIWMFPPTTQMSVDWAKELLLYRYKHLVAAQYYAITTGSKGARFPWESAYTGTETTQPCCEEVAIYQIHISADIVFAIKQLYAVTNDKELLCSYGWPITREVAKYIASRVVWNDESSTYHVNHVMPPDEDHYNVNNSIYTNVIFKRVLEFAAFSKDICNVSETVDTDNWLEIAYKLLLIYDPANDYHPEYDSYTIGTRVKQADVILLGYPLLHAMNDSTRHNDLEIYANVTRESGPAMTWSMFSVNYLDINNSAKADSYFTRCYEEYARKEFKVWSEVKRNYKGSANFLTGIGGFLQAIMNGYGGIRFYNEGEQSVMKLQNTRSPLPNRTAFKINGIKFGGSLFSLEVAETGDAQLVCLELGAKVLEARKGFRKRTVTQGFKLDLAKSATAYIRTT